METTLYFHTQSGDLRAGLTIYFGVIILLITFVGGICLKYSNQVRVLRNEDVPVSHMIPWLGLVDTLTYILNTRHFPGGWMTTLFLLSALFGYTNHILVSKFVQTVMLKGECTFGTGLVMATSPSFFINHRTDPSSQWPPARIAAEAQAISKRNGCAGGIYWKANQDPNFCAGPADVAGEWSCKNQNQDTMYPASTSSDSIYDDLYSKSLQYDEAAFSFWRRPENIEIGLIEWGPSVGDDVEEVWDVRVSINIDLNPNNTIHMKSFFCSMKSANATFILKYTNSYTTLRSWGSTLFGNLGGTIGDRTGDMSGTIESTLNAIVMVGGSGNGANHTTNATQGCLVPGTEVPFLVSTMIVVNSVFLILLLVYWLILCLQRRKSNKAVTSIPHDLPTWQDQALRQTLRMGVIDSGQAAGHLFGVGRTEEMYGLLGQTER